MQSMSICKCVHKYVFHLIFLLQRSRSSGLLIEVENNITLFNEILMTKYNQQTKPMMTNDEKTS